MTLTYVDDAVDCAICLSPLVEEECITLTCGHRWHLRCVEEQLRHAVPQAGKRLLFTGCRCAKCGAFCDHPSLERVVRSTANLRDEVDELIREQAIADGLYRHYEVVERRGRFHGDVVGYGRSVYAFYLCSVCEKPYFGGTVDCADTEEGSLTPAQRVCDRCSPAVYNICTNAEHTPYRTWKCRYCCRSATHVCYGGTHFCDSCHDRDGLRVRTGGPPLEPIPCIGAECSTPFREGQTEHKNGPGRDCEQVIHCSMCESDPNGAALEDSENVSRNYIYNPDASLGLNGWTSIEDDWGVETSDIQFRSITHNFVSSYSWASMVQAVDLTRYLVRPDLAGLRVSVRYMGRHDCPSVFRLKAVLFSISNAELAQQDTGELSAPQDFWERASLLFPPTAEAACVVVCVMGKDSRFWAGPFGSKCTDIRVEVLFDGSDSPPEEILHPEEVAVSEPTSTTSRNCLRAFHRALAQFEPPYILDNEFNFYEEIAEDENVSRNLLFNADASQGTDGWTTTGQQWNVEPSSNPAGGISHNFVSSFEWASMAQAIDLTQFLNHPGQAAFRVSALYMARHDCESVFRMRAALYSSTGLELEFDDTEELEAPQDGWKQTILFLPPNPRAASLVVCVMGKDTLFWQGPFGSKCTDIRAEVLFDFSDSAPDQIMRPGEPPLVAPASNVSQIALRAFRNRDNRQVPNNSRNISECVLS